MGQKWGIMGKNWNYGKKLGKFLGEKIEKFFWEIENKIGKKLKFLVEFCGIVREF